jgi:hypothetical protein
VIKRDIKTFLFELILPLVVIICALFLMKINFIKDPPAQYINLNTYLGEQNPVVVPIGSSNAALRTSVGNSLGSQYGSSISVRTDTTYVTAATFDQFYLSPIKKSQSTLKGGIFYEPSSTSGTNTFY